jgi:deazaflavin-dependent oxidoreductase (nitroreductase family)
MVTPMKNLLAPAPVIVGREYSTGRRSTTLREGFLVGRLAAMESNEPLDSALPWVAEHTRKYVESGGAEGHDWQGVPTLVLTTTGRKSGQPRRNALIYGQDGDSYVIVASYGGAPDHPLWYRNLVADPVVGVQVGPDTFAARARDASPEEKARLWSVMTGIWPAYDEYQAKTDRQIPVVILDPL